MAYNTNWSDEEKCRNKNPKTCTNQNSLRNDVEILPIEIFGVDVTIYQCQSKFQVNGCKIINLATEIFTNYNIYVNILDRLLIKEELTYYATALFWLRCISIKAKQGRKALTFDEGSIWEAADNMEFNVPEPLYMYLSQMGNVDSMKIRAEFSVPPLPSTNVGGFGGYHSEEINKETHNVYEELPCLGIAADMIMAAVSTKREQVPNFHIRYPVGSVVTRNLCGNIEPSDSCTGSVRNKLIGWGITESEFPEYVPNTRFYLLYLRSISDIIGKFKTFNIKKVCFERLVVSGSECQLIKTIPIEDKDLRRLWTNRLVLPEVPVYAIVDDCKLLQMSIVFGFQLHKEAGAGGDVAARMANWSCIRPEGEEPWVIPEEWVENRNTRRDISKSIRKALCNYQDEMMREFVHSMIVSECWKSTGI